VIDLLNRILVTGGAGFIGRHLIKRLSQIGCTISVIDNLSNSNYNFQDTKISFHREDIRNKEAILDILKNENIDTCIHLAAKISVSDSIVNPYDTMDVNIQGTLNVLEACSINNVRNFVFASSAAAYGEPKQMPISEDHVLDPLSPYGASKMAGEVLISSYSKFSRIQNAVSLRFFNVYGEGQTLEYAGVITKFAERLNKGLRPIIYGDGMQTRDFVSVNDVVTAIVMAAQLGDNLSKASAVPKIYNVASGKSISISDLASKMIKISGLDITPIFEKEREGDIKYAEVDTIRSKSILGFVANETIESGLKQLMQVTSADDSATK